VQARPGRTASGGWHKDPGPRRQQHRAVPGTAPPTSPTAGRGRPRAARPAALRRTGPGSPHRRSP